MSECLRSTPFCCCRTFRVHIHLDSLRVSCIRSDGELQDDSVISIYLPFWNRSPPGQICFVAKKRVQFRVQLGCIKSRCSKSRTLRMYVQAGLFFRTSEDSCRVKTAAVGRYCLLGLYVFTRKQPAVQAIHASSKLSGPSSNNNGYDRLTAVYGQRSFSVFICNRSAHSGVFAHFF